MENKDILKLVDLSHEDLISVLLTELVYFSESNDFLPVLLEHLRNTGVKDDVNSVLIKMREDKINTVLDGE